MKVKPGPGKIASWGVPDGTRDQESGDLVHDDLVISGALCSVLETLDWGQALSAVVDAFDPLEGLDDVY
jgi:hypothetical protein